MLFKLDACRGSKNTLARYSKNLKIFVEIAQMKIQYGRGNRFKAYTRTTVVVTVFCIFHFSKHCLLLLILSHICFILFSLDKKKSVELLPSARELLNAISPEQSAQLRNSSEVFSSKKYARQLCTKSYKYEKYY